MKALTYHGPHHVSVDTMPDPALEAADDIILRVTATAICGSDLHLYRGFCQIFCPPPGRRLKTPRSNPAVAWLFLAPAR